MGLALTGGAPRWGYACSVFRLAGRTLSTLGEGKLGSNAHMVASGALAALSVKHASKRWSGFGEFARRAPYFSGALIVLVGLYVGYHGLMALI